MENNISMNYIDLIIATFLLLLVCIIVFIIGFLFLRLGFHLVLSSEIHNKDVKVKVSIRCFFNLININKTIYPVTKSEDIEKKKKNKKYSKLKLDKNKEENLKSLDFNKVSIEDIKVIYSLIRKIKIYEIYSELGYGSEIIEFTSFIYVFVNIIYGNIYNYFDSKEMYLKVIPCYTKNYINYISKLHIKITIKDILGLSIAMIKIYKKIKKYGEIKNNKEGELDEISQFNKEFNGYNS